MKIVEKRAGKAIILELAGRLDSASSKEVDQKIIDEIEHGSNNVILDFSSLDYISSAGIRVLVHCHKELEKKHGHIFLAAVPKSIENVLYITGFLSYFKIYDGQSQALHDMNELKD